MAPGVTRVVALGASNLSLGFQTILATARSAWGEEFELLAAPGYGRSYGAPSSIAGRTLPGILESGLWAGLRARPEAPTRGLITDVGNDILCGFRAAQILAWVEEAVDRLLVFTRDIAIAGLPAHRVRLLTPRQFLFFRSVFFPPSRVSREDAFASVDAVHQGLERLAEDKKLRFVPLRPEWYSFDPIHFRPGVWPRAWREILHGEALEAGRVPFSAAEWARLHTLPPERRWLLGLEQATPQTGRKLRRGGRLWLY
jgi:hypothetical protein